MDIELFSEMVKDLILDNDEVTLPGLGTFVSELVPSTFSDKGYTINPPYRKLSFRQKEGGDDLLVNMYARANSTEPESASKILKDFLADLKQTLCTRKTVVLPGLGRLRATRENTFFFIPDEDLDISKYGFGLAPVSLKTHVETDEEVSEAIAGLESILSEPLPEPDSVASGMPDQVRHDEEVRHDVEVRHDEEVLSDDQVRHDEGGSGMPDQARHDEGEPGVVESGGMMKRILVWTSSAIGAAALFLGIFMLLARVAPDFMNRLLYSPEELEIISKYNAGGDLKIIHSASATPESNPQQSTTDPI